MDNIQTRVYRNDSDTDYNIPGIGVVLAGQRVTFQGEFPPAVNLQNYPGLVDVLDEEKNGTVRDYGKHPETTDAASESDTTKGGSNNG